MDDEMIAQLVGLHALRESYSSALPGLLQRSRGILDRVDLVNAALVTSDWARVRSHAAACRNRSDELLTVMNENAQLESEIVSGVRSLALPLQAVVDSLPAGHDPDQLVAATVSLVAGVAEEFPANLEQLVRSVVENGTNAVGSFFEDYDLRAFDSLRRLVADVATLGKVRSVWSRQLADVTQVIRVTPPLTKGSPFFNESIFAQHEERIAVIQQRLREQQVALHEANSRGSALAAAGVLRQQVETDLTALAQTQGALYLAGYALRLLGKGEMSEEVGLAAAAAGLLGRELIASYAAAHRIANRLVDHCTDDDVDEVLDSAAQTPFESGGLPDGTNTSLGQLADVGDGGFVEVRGYVQSVQTVRIDGGSKLISRATLKDPSSGATGEIVALFVNLRHLGVTGGCYLVASGRRRASSVSCFGQARGRSRHAGPCGDR